MFDGIEFNNALRCVSLRCDQAKGWPDKQTALVLQIRVGCNASCDRWASRHSHLPGKSNVDLVV